MKLNCIFDVYKFPKGDEYYQCKVLKNEQELPQNSEFEFVGKHFSRKSNLDVTFLEFYETNCPKVPQGLTKIFPNLKVLGIYNSKLKELTRIDLAEYKNLEKFICTKNLVDFLPGDLFEGFINLKYINFYSNKLEIIEPNLLDNFDDLDYVNFIGNTKYATSYEKSAHYVQKTTLDDVKNHLFERFFHLKFEIFSSFVKKYPDPEKILQFYGKKASNHQIQIFNLENKYRLYDELRPKEIEEIKDVENKLTKKCEELEKSNLELHEELNKLTISKSNLDEQIEKLKVELKNEKQEKLKLKRNLQKQIDLLGLQLQSLMLVNVEN